MGKQKKLRELKRLQEKEEIDNSVFKKNSYKKIPSWQYLIPPIVLSFLAIIFYAPSIHYSFQFDDIANIKKSFAIRHHTLSDLFFTGSRWISYWLNAIYYSIGQFNPFPYRIGNILTHIISGLLVFFILLLALKHLKKKNFFSEHAFAIALLSAIMFLLHPVQTQTVSYIIQGQLEGLAAMFILGITFFFLKYSYAKTTGAKYFFATLMFILAAISCGTKEIAIISPLLILLIDWFFVAQGDIASIKKRAFIHIMLFSVIGFLYIYFLKPTFFTEILGFQRLAKNNLGNVITQNPADKITPWAFFISQFKVILHYLWMFIWPFGISVEYDWVLSKGILAPDSFFPLLGLICIGVIIFKLLKKDMAHLAAFGLLWFFISIAPRSSIIPSSELLVDYKTYTASFGWLFLLSAGILYLVSFVREHSQSIPDSLKKMNHVPALCALLLAIPLGFLTLQRNTIWRSGIEFWGDMIKKAPGKARAYNNYGVELSQNIKDYAGSIPYFKKAIAMDAKYPDPWNNLAIAYSVTGELELAIDALKQSLRIHPYHPEGYNNLASFLLQKNQLEEAEKMLDIAIKMRPHYGKAYLNLGRIYLAKGEKEKAWQYFKKCCTECDFDNEPHGFDVYAKVSMMLQKYEDAIFGYQKALQFDPQYPGAIFGLANAYFMAKQYDNAIHIYNQIVQVNPTDFKVWYNLGESYFAKGHLQTALDHYKKAGPISDQLPYLSIRTANCLEKMGRPQEAKQLLEQFISTTHSNSQIAAIQESAKVIIAQINTKYSLT